MIWGNTEIAAMKEYEEHHFNKPEPIGLYFASLWYSEKIYHTLFPFEAFVTFKNIYKNQS